MIFYEGARTNNECVLGISPILKAKIESTLHITGSQLFGCAFVYTKNYLKIPNASDNAFLKLISILTVPSVSVKIGIQELNIEKKDYLKSFFLR